MSGLGLDHLSLVLGQGEVSRSTQRAKSTRHSKKRPLAAKLARTLALDN